MELQKRWLIVRDLEEYFFCPRMFYLKHVLGYSCKPGQWSQLGKDIQQELSKHIHVLFNVVGEEVYLESPRLFLRGRVDYIVDIGYGLAPLEIKYTRRIRPWWRYTLVLYSLLTEEVYNKPVKEAYIMTISRNIYRIYISDHDRNYVINSLDRARRIIEGRDVPRMYRSRSCINCDYKVYCNI